MRQILIYDISVTLNAGDCSIDLVRKVDKYFIPLHTFSDVFLIPVNAPLTLCNGHSILLYSGIDELYENGECIGLGKICYGKDGEYAAGKVSSEMAGFSWNELCFTLDRLYGLKEKHKIVRAQ